MNNKKGFTLIELLVVIAIIGLLSTLSVLALNNARQKSRDAKRVADIKQIQTALELYYNDAYGYPLDAEVVSGIELNFGTTVYMNSIPSAPTPQDGDCTSGASGTNVYTYTQNGSGASYDIEYCIGAATGEIAAGLNTATPGGIQSN